MVSKISTEQDIVWIDAALRTDIMTLIAHHNQMVDEGHQPETVHPDACFVNYTCGVGQLMCEDGTIIEVQLKLESCPAKFINNPENQPKNSITIVANTSVGQDSPPENIAGSGSAPTFKMPDLGNIGTR